MAEHAAPSFRIKVDAESIDAVAVAGAIKAAMAARQIEAARRLHAPELLKDAQRLTLEDWKAYDRIWREVAAEMNAAGHDPATLDVSAEARSRFAKR